MDSKYFTLFIGYIALLSPTNANFPFQTGPIIFNPYAPFFGSSELNPFESNSMQIGVNKNHYNKRPSEDDHPLKHSHKPYKSYMPSKYQYKDYTLEPLKWKKFSTTQYANYPSLKGLPKRDYKKMVVPAPKYKSEYNKGIIRPKPQTDVNMKKHFSYQTNHFNPKSLFNYKEADYKNSNSFRQSVPQKPLFSKSHSSHETKASDSSDRQSALDIELSGDEEDDLLDYEMHNKGPNRVQYISPPNHFKSDTNANNNYVIKQRVLDSSDSRFKRPALYEIEAPKNLNKDKPVRDGPGFVQKIPVTRHTLMQIADITGPPKSNVSPRPHPFEGFYQKSNFKSEPEIIVNAVDDGMSTTKQVGASMTVQLDEREVLPKGKIFDEPLSDVDRRYENSYRKPFNPSVHSEDHSYSQKPFRPNDRNPFNSKHFDTFSTDTSNNNNNNNKHTNDNSFMESEAKSDYDYDSNGNPRDDSNQYSKSQNNYPNDESDKLPNPQSYTDNRSQTPSQESESEKSEKSEDNFEEWTSNGIPGEPGKDYPMLSSAPAKSDFSCVGRPHGFYADVSQKCQVYHQCAPQGQQRFLCPNGTLYSQESLVCEWWYNVNCENSERLYHKNAQLYDNDNQKLQNDDNIDSNDEKSGNEYEGEDNPKRNGNHQSHHNHHNSNYHKRGGGNHMHNHNDHNDHNGIHGNHHNIHNHLPHSHNHRRNPNSIGSGRYRQLYTSNPFDTTNDEDIDVELSNDESRHHSFKSPSTLQFVSYLKQLNDQNNNNHRNKNRHIVLFS